MSIAEALSATPVSSVDLTRYVAVPADVSVGETVGLMCAAGGKGSYMAPMTVANSLMQVNAEKKDGNSGH